MKKEKINRQVILQVQPSLFGKFKKGCEENYKTVSEVLRELMGEYVRKNESKN
jgi:hypothetical protein